MKFRDNLNTPPSHGVSSGLVIKYNKNFIFMTYPMITACQDIILSSSGEAAMPIYVVYQDIKKWLPVDED